MVTACFRFYEELNDFLPAQRRKREFECDFPPRASVKHAIEALGVPHTEVEVVLVNGVSVDFARQLQQGDRVSVYPAFESFDVAPLLRLRPAPLRETRFVADAHLGALARWLRMAGLDTLFRNHMEDDEIVAVSRREGRIVLTRDRELLKRREVTHGCYVHAREPGAQFREVVARLQLERAARPFSRCLECNTPLQPVARAQVLDRLPPRVADLHEDFRRCPGCDRVYWEGSHFDRMRRALAELLAGVG